MGVVFDQVPASDNIVMAYRPVSTRVTLTIAESAEPRAGFIEMMKCTVKWNGVEVAEFRKDWWSRIETTPTNWEYIYDLDVQRLVQNELLPRRGLKSGTFGDVGVKRLGDFPVDGSGDVIVDVDFYYRDDDNLLKLLPGGAFTNNEMVCVPFALPQNQQQYLYGDGLYVYAVANDVVNWLSNMPSEGVNIALDDNAWASFIHNGNFNHINGYRVRIYNSGGFEIDVKTMKYDEFLGNDKRLITVGVGVVQINDAVTDVDWWYESTAPDGDLIGAEVDHYLVDFGFIDGVGLDGNFDSHSNSLRFNVRSVGESRSFRIHFLNRFGAGEAYTFDCKRVRKTGVSSKRAKKSLSWDMSGAKVAVSEQHNVEDYGEYRIGIKSGVVYDLESKGLSDEKRRWLEELDDTIEAYYEDKESGVLVRLVINDSGFIEVEDSDEFEMKMKLSVSMSNDVIRQRF